MTDQDDARVPEALNQEMLDLKSEVARLTISERNYQAEIEALQTLLDKEQQENQIRINTLENEKREVEIAKMKAIEDLETVLHTKTEELKSLRDELDTSSKNRSIDEIQGLNNKIQELDSEIGKLKNENDSMRECITNLEKDTHVYEESINHLKDDYNILNENYNRKTDDLNETKKLAENLQEELDLLKTELDVLKNKTDKKTNRGSSLFTEVEEKRVRIQTKINQMKVHYDEMKRQISNLEDQVVKMRSENGAIKQSWENDDD